MDIWSELGIERTSDRAAIRRAYARKLKINRPEQDPAGFERLRHAYEVALGEAEDVHAGAFLDEPPPVREPVPVPPEPVSAPDPRRSVFRVHERSSPIPEDDAPEVGAPELEPEPELELDEDEAWADEQGALLWEALHKSDGDRATSLLAGLLAHESMSSFESRWHLEQWLLTSLAEVPLPSPRFIRVAVHEFRWSEDATRLPPHYRDMVDGLLAELELDDLLKSWAESTPSWSDRFFGDGHALGRWLLGGPHRPLWCDFASLRTKIFSALSAEWRELEIFGQEALSRRLAPEKYAWWMQHVAHRAPWFLRLAQIAHRLVLFPVALAAIICVAGLPIMLTDRIEGSSLLFSFYVPYFGITLGTVLFLTTTFTGLSLLVLRAGRGFDALAARPLAAIARFQETVHASTLGRYRAWLTTLSPLVRRLVDLVALVSVTILLGLLFVAYLWLQIT